MKYTVTVMEHTPASREVGDYARNTWHYFSGLSLGKARRLCERHARRGVKRFGGEVARLNWGTRGGVFPDAYRSATIRVTEEER